MDAKDRSSSSISGDASYEKTDRESPGTLLSLLIPHIILLLTLAHRLLTP